MSEVTLCSQTTLCKAMEMKCADNEHGKGLSVLHTMNLGTGEERMLGVVYKTSANDKGLLLNVCPWCRREPGYFERATGAQS